jgi:hypothetical protein
MKVLVLYETSREMQASENLADVLNHIGSMLANSSVNATGTELHINAGTRWNIEATVAAFNSLPKPRIIPARTRNMVRELILDDEGE